MINSVEILVIGRFIVGLGAGLTTSTIPLYLAELVPLRLREKFGVLTSVGITGGIVLGQIMSLSEVFGTADLWEYALSFYGILVALCLIPYWKYPESPKFLYMVEANKEEASKGNFILISFTNFLKKNLLNRTNSFERKKNRHR